MVSGVDTATALNADYGLGVTCTADFPGLYGWVKNKRTGAAIAVRHRERRRLSARSRPT